VRQGDTISPKLFTAVLQEIFRRVEWSEDGVNVSGRKLNHLRFADDIVLISNNTNDLQARLQELNNSSKISGMKINMNKTKVIFNKQILAQNKNSKRLKIMYIWVTLLKWTTTLWTK